MPAAAAIAVAACLATLGLWAAPAVALERGAPGEPDTEPSASPRIVGGSAASTATYTWQAAIVLDEAFNTNDFDGQFCGGSLIAPRIVITAAHCVYDTDPDCYLSVVGTTCLPSDVGAGADGTTRLDPNDANVVLGRDTLTGAGGEERDLQAVYLHPGFERVSLRNDVAFLILATPSARAPIRLAGPGETAIWAPGSPTEASGWGRTSEGGTRSNTLRAVTVPIMHDSICAAVYGARFHQASMVCAGYLEGGKDSCQGDSGGPLQAPALSAGAATYRLVGVTSWGSGCAQRSAPGVYARVGGGSALHDTVVAQVAQIEAEQGLAPRNIVGSGAVPRNPSAPPPPPPPPPSSGTTLQPDAGAKQKAKKKALKKCRKISKSKKKKRRKCFRKVRRRFR